MVEGRESVGRVAALDIGDVWTGIALSDETRSLARPVEVVRSEKLREYLDDLSGEDVTEVIVGVPKTLSGETGFQARRVLDILFELRDEFPTLKFIEWDERFTTRMARRDAGRGGAGKRKSRKHRGPSERVDHLAAAWMLQEYLESGGTLEAQ